MTQTNDPGKLRLSVSPSNILNTVLAAACIGVFGFAWTIHTDIVQLKVQMEQMHAGEDRRRLWAYTTFLHDEVVRLDYKAGLEPSRTPDAVKE